MQFVNGLYDVSNSVGYKSFFLLLTLMSGAYYKESKVSKCKMCLIDIGNKNKGALFCSRKCKNME